MSQEAQKIPSRDPHDPNFRRLWYTRYADDFLLGLVGTKAEAVEIKQKLAAFLRSEIKLELSEEKTLVTHARDEKARFLGYEIYILHADDKHDHRGQRCINGSVGLRVPASVINAHGMTAKPFHVEITGERRDTETVMRRLEGGAWKSASNGNSLVAYPTSSSVLSVPGAFRAFRQAESENSPSCECFQEESR